MVNVVDIEDKTLSVLFSILNEDVKLMKMAEVKNWEKGVRHYHRRISGVLKNMAEIERLIDGVINDTKVDIKDMKTTGANTNQEPPSSSLRSEMIRVRNSIKQKINTLKGLHFEKEMLGHGFKETEEPPITDVKSIRRLGDGSMVISDLEN